MTRRIAVAVLLMAIASNALAQYGESITVSRVLVDVRVTKANGEPVADFDAADFEVWIDGEQAAVKSSAWIEEGAGAVVSAALAEEEEEDDDATTVRTGIAPRNIVVFVQTDFQRAQARMQGQMKFRTYAEELIQSFEPQDRIAVFSFDSHLKFRCDLSTDRDDAIQALRNSILIDAPPPPRVVPSPSLASKLNAQEMKRATSSEEGLMIVAEALKSIEGPKTLLLLGWGLGEKVGRMLIMRPEWKDARRALDAARVAIISLDTTAASYHDLQYGLSSAAEQTGGFYASTNEFAKQAIDRVQRTLSGRYELELIPSKPLDPGVHSLQVRVSRRGMNVLAPTSITISTRN
jgi:VWFA-related protein